MRRGGILAMVLLLCTSVILAQGRGEAPGSVAGIRPAASTQALAIPWWTVDSGGSTLSTGGTFTLGATAGQPDAGSLAGGAFTLTGGFWTRGVTGGPSTIYLPAVLRDYSPLANGGFEDGWAGWTHGGDLSQAIISDDGWSGPHSGTYAARLGSPSYECEWGVPVGSAWIQGTFSVPSTGASKLRIHYRIFSEDTYGTGQYDRFEILVNGVEMLSDGNMGDWGCDSPARSEGWESWDLDLTGYHGTNITLRLENITFDTYANTWTYVDDIQFVP